LISQNYCRVKAENRTKPATLESCALPAVRFAQGGSKLQASSFTPSRRRLQAVGYRLHAIAEKAVKHSRAENRDARQYKSRRDDIVIEPGNKKNKPRRGDIIREAMSVELWTSREATSSKLQAPGFRSDGVDLQHMPTIFLSISYDAREALAPEIEAIADTISQAGYVPKVFINYYQFTPGGEKKMMQQSYDDIAACHIFIAEVSDKAIGVGIEAGIARALGKPIIYLLKKGHPYSKTVGGIADHYIVYDSIEQLRGELAAGIAAVGSVN